VAPRQKPGKSKQDYRTPPEFLQAVRVLLGIRKFSLDAAADIRNRVCPLHYSKERNGLHHPWSTRITRTIDWWVWCNPPYADIDPWVRKAYVELMGHGVQSALLLPAAVGSLWWANWVHEKALVQFIRPRLVFVGETAPYPKDLALVLYSPQLLPGYEPWDWKYRKKKIAP
jgi:phage N-6-adenine-methyltransferase